MEKKLDKTKIQADTFPSVELLIFMSSAGMLFNLLLALAIGMQSSDSPPLLLASFILGGLAILLSRLIKTN